MKQKNIMRQDNDVVLSYEKSERGYEFYVNNVKLDRFDLLALACRCEDKNEAWELMNLASRLYHPQDDEVFNVLYGAVAMEITRNNDTNEFYYQKLFKDNVKLILGKQYKLLKNKKNNPHHIPDAWVEMNGEEIPVEVKRGCFDKKALRQLKRYMFVYQSKQGIAVAKELTVDLPENIIFVSLAQLEGVAK